MPAEPGHAATGIAAVVPTPVWWRFDPHADFEITRSTSVDVPDDEQATSVGDYLAGLLRPATGFPLPVATAARTPAGISLRLGGDPRLGDQGYELAVSQAGVILRARSAAGLFAGAQTVRQLLADKVESTVPVPGPWRVPGGQVVDYPRFPYRGAMLDVARHFFSVDQVRRYIDQIALYKINHLHLHLTDDQGWRIEIRSWPRLAAYGGSTQVGGGAGGYYSQDDYRALVAYAASRHVTIVPEIDMPGHTNAALACYPELSPDGVAPALYTGVEVGFSSLHTRSETTYRFVDDVLGELAALTPGPYLHIGSDEAKATTSADHRHFVDRVLPLVARRGKQVAGWHELLGAVPPSSALIQYWGRDDTHPGLAEAAGRGNPIVLSPASRAYLDMKYDASNALGLAWAGFVDVADAYDWDPGGFLRDVPEHAVLGVEAPLWSETLTTSADIERMAFPRLPAIAELGWSPRETHDWTAFRLRLAAQGPRWAAMGLTYHPSDQVPWPG